MTFSWLRGDTPFYDPASSELAPLAQDGLTILTYFRP
jgi:hypothetical protein